MGCRRRISDAATIARRVFALPDRAEDVGAMLARNLIWRMQTRMGDGAATAAVLAQDLLRSGVKFTAAGGNAMTFRAGVSQATAAATAALRAAARPAARQPRRCGGWPRASRASRA